MELLERKIEGLDVAEGVKNCGSEALFFSLLGDFYKLIDGKSAKIEEYLRAERLRDYTIEVHGLKNTARMIGAMELSQLFYQMEQLGNAGAFEEVKARTPELLELFRSYKHILEPYGKQAGGTVLASAFEIKKTVKALHDAMDAFDLDVADKAMRKLESYELPAQMQGEVQKLSAYVADVAMEEVLRMTEELLAMPETAFAAPGGQKPEAAERAFAAAAPGAVPTGGQAPKLATKTLAAGNRKAHILLVDDDALSSKVVMFMLQDEYEVFWEQSAKTALKHLAEELPDLILLDVHMPGMDGHGMLQTLKEDARYADIPVVFLTSDEDEHTEIQGFSEGATDFIRKPFRKNVAVQRINRILELSYLQKNLKQEVEKQTAVAVERQKRIERIALQMVQALANTIDAKDAYTNGHSTRVAKYSVMLAERMGYEGDKLEQLYFAAILHDIGKIGIPKEIINKPSRLTDEEYKIIQSHPVIGANILDEVTEIPYIATGARWHHERYDGKGYPDGLSGEEIPELARIIGVADAYDAMTSKRSYRDVLPQEVVLGEIEKGKGSQFDPEIAEVMISLMKEDTDYILHE